MNLLSGAPNLLSIEETLINCILFIWFENLQNNLKNSCRHLDSGLKIIEEARRRQQLNTTGMVETILAPTLERLKLKADIYSASGELGSSSDREHLIPERFLDVEQAHQSFTRLINWSCYVLGHITLSKNNSDNWHLRSSKLARRLSGFDLYSARLEDLLREARSEREPDKLQAVLLLKINDLVVQIIVSVYLYLQESAYDRQKSNFAQIVDLCQEYLASESVKGRRTLPPASSNGGDLIFENGIIPHLLFTSAHCRDHWLRQRVISLLKQYTRCEGAWESHIASKVANRIAELEKQDLTLPMGTSEAVPEADLIRVLGVCFYSPGTYSTSADKMGGTEQGRPLWDHDRCLTFPTRIKISFLRCQRTDTETLIEEVWIDETGKSIMVSSSSPSCSVSSFFSKVTHGTYGGDYLLTVHY